MRQSASDGFSSASERLGAPGDGKLIVGRGLIVPSRLASAVNHVLRSKGRVNWDWISQEELDDPYAELRPYNVLFDGAYTYAEWSSVLCEAYTYAEWGLWCSKCKNWFVCHWRGPHDG